jgi:hypothetical protein
MAAFALALSFGGVTDPFFSCLVPTEFFGNLVAAYAPPPRTRKMASVAATFE